jgi:hypothetical protein
MMDRYKKLRNTRKRDKAGFYDRRAGLLHPNESRTVTDENGDKVNRFYGSRLAEEALEKARTGK